MHIALIGAGGLGIAVLALGNAAAVTGGGAAAAGTLVRAAPIVWSAEEIAPAAATATRMLRHSAPGFKIGAGANGRYLSGTIQQIE